MNSWRNRHLDSQMGVRCHWGFGLCAGGRRCDMRFRSLITVALTVFVLFVAPAVTARADSCPASVSPASVPETTSFYNNDKLLGPAELPKQGPVAKLLGSKYDRFGGMSQADWERTFRTGDNDNPWKWPPTVSGFNPKWGPPYGAPNEKKKMLTTSIGQSRPGGRSTVAAVAAPTRACRATRYELGGRTCASSCVLRRICPAACSSRARLARS
jgi:hypothetical protein